MFGGLDPKKMQAMMKQMGIQQEDVAATRVIIEGAEKRIVIEEPSVTKITMQGQTSWQIAGSTREEEASGFNEDDVKLVCEQAKVSEAEARAALEKAHGDLAHALASFN